MERQRDLPLSHAPPPVNTRLYPTQVVYLFFFNALWVWVPAIVAADSGAKIVAACDKAKVEATDGTVVGDGWWTFAIATIALYGVVVPAVMLTSKA